MSNSSIEEEQPTLNTTRRRLIRQSLGKYLGRTGEATSSLSNNIDDPFQPLSVEEQKKAFYRHKLLAECEKANRPVNPNIPEDTEILEVEPVSIRYHLRSFANTQFDQYGSNVGHIGINTMPRVKRTSYHPEVAARDAAEKVKSSKKAKQGEVASSSKSDDMETPPNAERNQPSPVHESAVNSVLGDDDTREGSVNTDSRDDIIDMTAEIIQEENLDEGYNSETDGAEFRQPIVLAAKGKVAEAKIRDEFRQTALEKDYCQRAKQFYKLPDGRTFFWPHPRFESIPERNLGKHKRRAVNHFDIIESDNGDGRVRITPKVWVPNAGYILGNASLSHVGLCWTNRYGVDKLDNKLLGLSVDGKRVIKRCPKATKPLYDTLATHCSRAPIVSAKRKAENMADENAKKRKLTSFANRRGGFPRFGVTRQPEDRSKKSQAENKDKPPSPMVQVKTVVQSSEPIVKKVVDGIDIEDLTNIESPTPAQPNIPDQTTAHTITTTAGGSDISAPGLIYQSNQWIERPNERIPEVDLNGFSVPLSHSGDKWKPAIDACRNESMMTDDPMLGGTLGYRLLSNLTLPMDRPAGVIGPLAAMHMHNMMKHHQASASQNALQTALDNADKALQNLKEAKERDDLEMSSLRDRASKVGDLQLEFQQLKTQITEKNKVISRVPTLEKDLEAAKASIHDLEEKVKKLEVDKPRVRQRAVRRFLTSQEFCTRLQNRLEGGWTAAQRCIAHAVGWKKEDWTAVEKAFNEEAFKIPSGFEEQEFSDEDLFNLAPADDEGVSDPSILDSPASGGTQA
uniref:Uncharacterized protein n=1 Tax=Chenopodium quinoa TaxID=63459 RepID=A0A803M771_CHEQI